MQVRELMTDSLAHVTPEATLLEAAQLMQKFDTGFLPVVASQNPKHLLGVLTDRDITVRAVAKGFDLHSAKVAYVMSSDPLHCATPDLTTSEAAAMMADRQVKRLCIVEEGDFIGVLALGDLAVTVPADATEALEGISRGARAEPPNPTEGEEKWEEEHYSDSP